MFHKTRKKSPSAPPDKSYEEHELSDEELELVIGGMGRELFEIWKIKILNEPTKRDEVGSS